MNLVTRECCSENCGLAREIFSPKKDAQQHDGSSNEALLNAYIRKEITALSNLVVRALPALEDPKREFKVLLGFETSVRNIVKLHISHMHSMEGNGIFHIKKRQNLAAMLRTFKESSMEELMDKYVECVGKICEELYEDYLRVLKNVRMVLPKDILRENPWINDKKSGHGGSGEWYFRTKIVSMIDNLCERRQDVEQRLWDKDQKETFEEMYQAIESSQQRYKSMASEIERNLFMHITQTTDSQEKSTMAKKGLNEYLSCIMRFSEKSLSVIHMAYTFCVQRDLQARFPKMIQILQSGQSMDKVQSAFKNVYCEEVQDVQMPVASSWKKLEVVTHRSSALEAVGSLYVRFVKQDIKTQQQQFAALYLAVMGMVADPQTSRKACKNVVQIFIENANRLFSAYEKRLEYTQGCIRNPVSASSESSDVWSLFLPQLDIRMYLSRAYKVVLDIASARPYELTGKEIEMMRWDFRNLTKACLLAAEEFIPRNLFGEKDYLVEMERRLDFLRMLNSADQGCVEWEEEHAKRFEKENIAHGNRHLQSFKALLDAETEPLDREKGQIIQNLWSLAKEAVTSPDTVTNRVQENPALFECTKQLATNWEQTDKYTFLSGLFEAAERILEELAKDAISVEALKDRICLTNSLEIVDRWVDVSNDLIEEPEHMVQWLKAFVELKIQDKLLEISRYGVLYVEEDPVADYVLDEFYELIKSS